MPIHGEPYMIRMHAKMAERELGIPGENIVVPDNGSIIEIREQGNKIVKLTEKIPADPRIVEGMKVKEKQEVVFRDRQALAADGIFIIVVAFDPKTGRVKKSPDIISRGFIYLRDNQHILQDVRDMVTTITEKTAATQKQLDFDKIKQNINDGISKFLKRSTHKNPMVISVVLGL
jgi:ribonuclease J